MTDFVFIDSGVGGIPYMTALLQKESQASCVYVADNANFPYGEKSHDEVVNCVVGVVQKICDKFEPGVIVLACNTISVNALETLRQKFTHVKFVGTVPAIKLAASVSKKKRIGLIASSSCCENPYNIELKNKFAADCELIMRADAELISFIEENGHIPFAIKRSFWIYDVPGGEQRGGHAYQETEEFIALIQKYRNNH